MQDREILYEGKFIRLIREDTWEFAERLHCSGVVFIIAVNDENKLILCEQHRVPVGINVIELPAGLVGDEDDFAGESMEDAVRRELFEETGYEAETIRPVCRGPVAAGSSSAIVDFFHAENLRRTGPGGGDQTENITVHEVPLDGVDAWLEAREAEGLMIDPRIFAGLYLLARSKK